MNMAINPRALQQVSPQEWVRPLRGMKDAPILVICDAQSIGANKARFPMELDQMKWFKHEVLTAGLAVEDFMLVSLCPPIHPHDSASDSRRWKHVQQNVEELSGIIDNHNPRLIVTFGELATRAVIGRSVAITKARGVPMIREGKPPVMPMFSPWYVRRKPENDNVFKADMATLARLKDNDFDPLSVVVTDTDYRWVQNLDELIAATPKVISYDTETTGLTWWKDETRVLVMQFTYKPGQTFLAPIHPVYFQKVFPGVPDSVRVALLAQCKQILEDPSVRKIGHNIKFDHHMSLKENVEVRGWLHDTNLMAFFVDENILDKSLDECTRLFVPEMSGYADQFNKHVDKDRMIDVPPDDVLDEDGKIIEFGMRPYAGGDTDATFRLGQRLDKMLRADPAQYRCYRRVQWPALLAFTKTVERFGIAIDKDALRALTQEVRDFVRELESTLIPLVPPALRREYIKRNEEMSLSRPKVLQDILFSKKGFGLKPQVFTKSTAKLPAKDRVPSTSIKDHLPYFKEEEGPGGEFVRNFIDWKQSDKMLSTYIGDEAENTGFWKYIAPSGDIFPSYKLSATVTGRTSSDNPNGQNFPKRGRFAKAYNKIFVPRPGYKLAACDFSQMELRIAAWQAKEHAMIKIYNENGDIHRSTAEIAANVAEGTYARHAKDTRILVEEHVANEFPGSGDYLRTLSPGARRTATVGQFIKAQRQKAKAINFGYLYGMSAGGFKEYAKTQYGVDVTDEEAEIIRTRYFTKYNRLPIWHDAVRKFVRKHGYVRALTGAKRNLPSIWSTDRSVQSEAERQAINSPIQRVGSDLGILALSRFAMQADTDIVRPLGFIHDAVVVEIKDGHEIEGLSALIYAMETLPLEEIFGLVPPLPIKADAEIGLSFGELYEIGDLPNEEDAPEWMREIGYEALSNLSAQKPSWWNDDWNEVNHQYHIRNTLNA